VLEAPAGQLWNFLVASAPVLARLEMAGLRETRLLERSTQGSRESAPRFYEPVDVVKK
jgi:hypothetical protein